MEDKINLALDVLINWFQCRLGKVTYSMESRYGPNSYDCSSAMYYALNESGFLPLGTMGNTETLFNHLEAHGWTQLNDSFYQKGDIFIWGVRGSTSGSAGHTGVFIDSENIIHCNFTANGISINNYESYWETKNKPECTVYRYTATDMPSFINYELKNLSGVFIPNRRLPVCSEPTQISEALDYYEAGQSINYDSYCVFDNYIWISYISYTGFRRFIAIGPDDSISSNVWGTGFDKTIIDNNEIRIINLYGTFIPNSMLPIYDEPNRTGQVIDYYSEGQSIHYDGYCINEGLIWITYISYSGIRRYIAVGPNDGDVNNIWGTGFDKSII